MAAPSRVRSVLFCPAVRDDHLAKAAGRGADVVIIDLEDATPPDAKAAGRGNVRAHAARLAETQPVWVRVNAVNSPWLADDLADGLDAQVSAVVVPKLESRAEVESVVAALDAQGRSDVEIVAGVETVLGVADAREVLAHERVIAAYFGAEDYVADLGGRRTESNHEVAHARASVAMACRLTGTAALDQVTAAVRDDERFRREATEALDLGYDGKLCLHPAQVVAANEVFTPTGEEVERAERIIAAHAEAVEQGVAVALVDGVMIDGPLVAQARGIVERAGGSTS